jgi:hypothetical protein
MLSDWRVLLFAGIIAIYGVSRLFKGKSSGEDIASLVERFHNELVEAETAVAHDAAIGVAFEPDLIKDPAVDPRDHAEIRGTVG